MTHPEDRLATLGIVLPQPPVPIANYVPFKLIGGLLFLSGQVPKLADGTLCTGRVGRDLDAETAYQHARLCGIQLIAVAKLAVGDLARLEAVKLLGLVNALPNFRDHPSVINGCSDLFVEVFGDKGRHARSAVGAGSLPNCVTVEVEAIFHVH